VETITATSSTCAGLRAHPPLYAPRRSPSEAALTRFRTLVKQALPAGRSAYLTGTKEFFSLPFEVCPDVLIPRPETEILVERTIDLARKSDDLHAILDLGTGSGCIAVTLARHLPGVRLDASDISEAALAVARRNASATRSPTGSSSAVVTCWHPGPVRRRST